MLLRAFAKINLDLQIVGRREDGYHEIRTILQTIDWFDEIHLDQADRFEFSAPGMAEDETNLVVRAVRAYEQLSGVTANVRIRLIKNIPIGRGLGGGSSDAAVTFMGLQRLFKKALVGDHVFRELRNLGSDVPFFTIGGTAAGFGRGDEVVRLEDVPDYWLVLVDPGIAVATAAAYSWLTLPARSHSIEGFCAPDAYGCGSGERANDFEVPVFERHPELAEIKRELTNLGGYRAALSGSGSALFGQFHTQADASRAASELSGRFSVKVTKPLPRLEYFQRIVSE